MNIVRTTTSKKFIINGREYHSLEEMPEAERQLFAAAQRVMADPSQAGSIKTERVVITDDNGVKRYVVNGKEYHSLEEVPEAERHLIENIRQDLAPAQIAEALKTDRFLMDKQKVISGLESSDRSPAQWTFTIGSTTLLWLALGLAVVTLIALLVAKGLGH